jgi:hypothetical protein
MARDAFVWHHPNLRDQFAAIARSIFGRSRHLPLNPTPLPSNDDDDASTPTNVLNENMATPDTHGLDADADADVLLGETCLSPTPHSSATTTTDLPYQLPPPPRTTT